MKEAFKATWEEVAACPVGSKFRVISPAYTQELIILEHKRDRFIWSFDGSLTRFECSRDDFIRWHKKTGELWFLLQEENAQPVSQSPKSTDNGLFCSCGGPSKKCDTGFAFSKVYYTCCNCKKEKR